MNALTKIETILDSRGIPHTHRKGCGGGDVLTFEVNGHHAVAMDFGDKVKLNLTLTITEATHLLEEVAPF